VTQPPGNAPEARLARLGRQRDFSLPRFQKAFETAARGEDRAELLRHLLTEWTGLHFTPEEASESWREIERLFSEMRERLGSPLGLQTVLVHHFHSRLGALDEPRVVSERDLSVLRVNAMTDPLTGLYNRRFLLEHLAREISRAERSGGVLSVVLMDLKDFKTVNDRFGHPVGDSVLVRTARVIRETLRTVDAGCRWGGDEFVLVLPNTHLVSAFPGVERIRRRVGSLALPVRSEMRIGLHYGIASYPADGKTGDFLLKTADLRLYQCREQSHFSGQERRHHPRFTPDEMTAQADAEAGRPWTAPVLDVGYGGLALRAPKGLKWPPRWSVELQRRSGPERQVVRLRALHWAPLPGGELRVGCAYV
jgi:diguanylate cyclase (GGDEF)-like protein